MAKKAAEQPADQAAEQPAVEPQGARRDVVPVREPVRQQKIGDLVIYQADRKGKQPKYVAASSPQNAEAIARHALGSGLVIGTPKRFLSPGTHCYVEVPRVEYSEQAAAKDRERQPLINYEQQSL